MRKFTLFLLTLLIFFIMLLNSSFVFAQEESEEVEGMNIIQNGNFDIKDLSPWEIILINIKEFNRYEAGIFLDYLVWARNNSEEDGGYVGFKQSLENYDITGKTKLILSFDILIFLQELDSDGWFGGEYPAFVELIFVNKDNEEYVYKKCFILKGSTINYLENNVTEIDKGDFYHFELDLMKDPKILESILSHPYLREIRVGGSGWDFGGAIDNIKLIVVE